jgi:hypothetical protein
VTDCERRHKWSWRASIRSLCQVPHALVWNGLASGFLVAENDTVRVLRYRYGPHEQSAQHIDPGVFRDPTNGTLWLAYGSYFGYIRVVELNPQTGKRLHPDRKTVNVAVNSSYSTVFRKLLTQAYRTSSNEG